MLFEKIAGKSGCAGKAMHKIWPTAKMHSPAGLENDRQDGVQQKGNKLSKISKKQLLGDWNKLFGTKGQNS